MGKLNSFMTITLNGFFADANGDMSWAHTGSDDPEWHEFVANNAKGGGVLMFGRVTYQMMASYWPTPMAGENNPVVAQRMNEGQKIVFSRTMQQASWSNTRLFNADLAANVRKLKSESAQDIVILGSGSLVAQLADEGLIDGFQLVVHPTALGAGKTIFGGMKNKLSLKLTQTRAFRNGNVLLNYEKA